MAALYRLKKYRTLRRRYVCANDTSYVE